MKCRICDRSAVNTYCDLHDEVHKRIIDKYEDWRVAMEISWIDYLKELLKNDHVGSWVKEIARHLLSDMKGDSTHSEF